MATQKQEMTYGDWKKYLDALVHGKVSLNLDDLADLNCRGAYEQGVLPEEFFDDVVRDELTDLGFAIEVLDFLDDDSIEVKAFDGDEALAAEWLAGSEVESEAF